MSRIMKVTNKFLNKFSANAISTAVLLLAYFVLLSVFCNTYFTSYDYSLSSFKYSVDDLGIGIINGGPERAFSYGPYTNLNSGNWKITIDYKADKEQSFDIQSKDSDNLDVTVTSGKLPTDSNSVSKVFNLEKRIINESLEYRTIYGGEGYFQLEAVRVQRAFVFKWYFVITLITAIVSLIAFMGKSLFKIVKNPKQTLYFAIFYLGVFLTSMWTMIYLPDQEGEGIYIIMDVLVVLHAWGLKKEVYKYLTRKNVLIVLGYIYLVLSLYSIDLILRYVTNENTDMTLTSYGPNLFSFAIIGIIMLLISFIPFRWMKRTLYGLIYYISLILLAVQVVYFKVFEKLFSFKDIKLAKEGSDYKDYVMGLIDKNFVIAAILLIIAGIVGILIIQKSCRMQKAPTLLIVSLVSSIIMCSCNLYSGDYGDWDSFNNPNYIYATFSNRIGAYKLCGFYQYELRDLKLSFVGNSAGTTEQKKEVEQYFADKSEHKDNEYTGLLEGKNVIFVLMESIDDIAIREDVMPTLYRMSKQGIYFKNMYSSIYGSAATLNAEMVSNVGLYAPTDGSLVYSFADNYFPYSLANLFSNKNYSARQYHFNDPTFYSRNLMNKAFGYKEYVCYKDYMENGYLHDEVIATNDSLYKTLIQDEQFFDYVISYSAHLSYDNEDGTVKIGYEKYPEYASLTSSEEINNYFVKARQTDDMFTELIAKLRASGKLQDTVFIAVGDHYPYGIEDVDSLYELSDVEKYTQLLYTTPFIIWSPQMDELGVSGLEVDKVCSSIDIVPTVVNLFNLSDTSNYVGSDILDESYEGLAYFSDGSWITKDAYYYNGSIVKGNLEKEKIDEINENVLEKITINDNILHSDYYR